MKTPPRILQLHCPQCAASLRCGPDEMLVHLRRVGLLRRENEPEAALVRELFLSTAARFCCSQCGHTGLTVGEATDELDDADWGQGRACQRCRQLIPVERLEFLPDAKLCATCQRAEESGSTGEPAEYCPRCGTPMVVRSGGSRGVHRYVQVCPACGRS